MINEAVDTSDIMLITNLKQLGIDLQHKISVLSRLNYKQLIFVIKYLKVDNADELLRFHMFKHTSGEAVKIARSIGHNDVLVNFLVLKNNKRHIYEYLRDVAHDDKLKHMLVTAPRAARYQYRYCRYISNDEDMAQALLHSKSSDAVQWQVAYCIHIENRDDFWEVISKTKDAWALSWYGKHFPNQPGLAEALCNLPRNDYIFDCYHMNLITKEQLKKTILKWGHSESLFDYADRIEDDPDIWKKLASLRDGLSGKYKYCRHVKDRESVWKSMLNVTRWHSNNIYWIYKYCRDVKDREEFWRIIADDPTQISIHYEYCKNVCDREEMWQHFTRRDPNIAFYQWLYYCDVAQRPEIANAVLSYETNNQFRQKLLGKIRRDRKKCKK